MTNETKLILEELKGIKEELGYIKEHMVDIDTILDEDDKQAIEQAEKEFIAEKTISLEQLKKKIGL